MASPSSSSCSSSSFGAPQSSSKHDVFLSFRGKDIGRNFTRHLYATLRRNMIHTFVDDEGIRRGDTLSPTLLSAIERSKISITIFSQNYASSAWCLDELVKIIECKEKNQLVVIPVFYHIDPSHVRRQTGTYEDAFKKHKKRFKDDPIKVQKWRTALHKAANSVGWDSSNTRMEADLVEQIVDNIMHKLNRMSPHVRKGLVGITRQIEHVESLLCTGSDDIRIIGIWGMDGTGKTTIADALYAKLSSQYEGSYFVANVREEWKIGRENELWNKLLAGLLGDQDLDISTPTMTSTFVVGSLQRKRFLIILDDVSDSKQIEYLVGEKNWFGPGSRIIMTTKNKDVFTRGVDGVYPVMELNFHEALELFSWNAFQQDHPMRKYQLLSARAVDYAQGNPLALKVLGSYLSSKRPKEWESALEKLKKIPRPEIYDVLRLCYEGLDPEEQNIFLNIACCSKGVAKANLTSILDGCGFSTDIWMRSLEDKSLITVSKGNEVQMHDLIQEMGWQIIREESMKEPRKQSRLWNPEEICDVIKYNKGTDSIESIALDMSQIKEVTQSPETFHRMDKLRLLKFYMLSCDKRRRSNVHISRGLEWMSSRICYIRLDCFPLKPLPSSFCAENLVELNIKHSLIEKLWDGVQDLVNLKSLNLCGCEHLIELPDLSMASKLGEVHLDDTSLLNVPSYIFSLESLFALNLRGCEQLRSIQSEKQSRSLQWLNLRGCSRLVNYSVFSEKLEYLNLDGTAIEELPSSVIGEDCTIQLLDCQKLERLPPMFDISLSITTPCLDNCSELSKHPDSLDLLAKLNKLSLRGSNIENLPGSIQRLSQLRALDVSNCLRLRSLPELPFLLQDLNASNCISLETVSNLGIAMLQDSFDSLKKRSLVRQIQKEEKMSIRHGDYFVRFEFYNCINLDQIACKTIMEEALIRIQLAAYLSSTIEEFYDVSKNFDPEDFVYISRPIYVIIPGSEVPDWFVHKRTDSLAITIKLFKRWLDYCIYPGFAFCVVVGPIFHSDRKKIHHTGSGSMAGCRYYFGDKYAGTCIIKSSCNYDAESDQVLLWYDKIETKLADGTSNVPPDDVVVEVSFKFFVTPGLVVKQCGIRSLHAPLDLDNMQSSNEEGGRKAHPPDSLGLPSGRQRISGYPDGCVGKSFPSFDCAQNVDILRMEHHCYGDSDGVEVFVYFGLVDGSHPQPHDLRCLAQLLQHHYCYFRELVDNISVFSSLRRLSLSGFNVESLPPSIQHLSVLEDLELINCKRLRSLPKLPPSLRRLWLIGCNVETLPPSMSIHYISIPANCIFPIAGGSKEKMEKNKNIMKKDTKRIQRDSEDVSCTGSKSSNILDIVVLDLEEPELLSVCGWRTMLRLAKLGCPGESLAELIDKGIVLTTELCENP